MFHNKAFHLLLATLLLLLSACKKENLPEGVVLIDADDAIEASITDVAENFKVTPLKSADPIDGINSLQFCGNKILAPGRNSENLMVFEDYTLAATLSRQGRGHGEYSYIQSYTYLEGQQAILVSNGSSTYMYSYPSMKFIGSPYQGPDYGGIYNAGDGILFTLTTRNFDDTDYFETLKSYVYLSLLNTEDGTVQQLDSCQAIPFSLNEISPSAINPDNRTIASCGYINRISTFSLDGHQTPVLEFTFADKGLSREIFEQDYTVYETEEQFNETLEKLFSHLDEVSQRGIDMIVAKDGTVSFQYIDINHDPSGYDISKIMAVSSGGKTAQYSKLTVPGLKLDLTPMAVHGTSYVCLIEADPEEIIDADAPLSQLAEQILTALKKQNDFNPILVEFSLKAPL